MVAHNVLTGADLHEPKGADTAASSTVYVFNGSGSGTAKKITTDSLDLTNMQNPNVVYLSTVINDISTASSVLVPSPEGCTFESALMNLGGAITGADSVISFARNDSASFGTSVTVTYTSSAEGDNYSFTATTNKSLANGGYVKISTDGASTGTVPLYITLKFIRVI